VSTEKENSVKMLRKNQTNLVAECNVGKTGGVCQKTEAWNRLGCRNGVQLHGN